MNPPVCASLLPRPANSPFGPPARKRRLISLTSLIDVVFILLIFFMLVTNLVDGRAIDLDAPARAAAGASMEGALLVEVRPGGVRLSGEPMSLDALLARVGKRLAQQPDQRVLIAPATGVSLQEAVEVLDRLAAAGATTLSLAGHANR